MDFPWNFCVTIRKGAMPFLNRYGLLDERGQLLLPEKFHAIWEVAPNLIGFREGPVFGLMNRDGEIIVDPCLEGLRKYDDDGDGTSYVFAEEVYGPSSFGENPSTIQFYNFETKRKLLLNADGDIISRFEFDWIGYVFPNGYAKVILNNACGVYNFRTHQYEVELIHRDTDIELTNKGEVIYARN